MILKTMHITLIIAGRLNCYHADFREYPKVCVNLQTDVR